MSKINARNALLFGSYISTSTLGNASIIPEFVAPEISQDDMDEAAKELISEGLIAIRSEDFPEMKVITDRLTCPYEITPRGKGVLGQLGPDLHQMAELGLFKIIIATGGSRVDYHEEKTQVSNVTSFEQNMIKHIDNADASDDEKQTAKSMLKEFLNHPLLGTVLSAVLGATLKS